jgi:hypothetical protein
MPARRFPSRAATAAARSTSLHGCVASACRRVLASREATHLARRLDGIRYQDRGSMTFNGLSDAVTVVRVVPETGDPVERLHPFAPPRAEPHRERSRWAIPVGAATILLALVAISVPLLRSNDPVAVGALVQLDPESEDLETVELPGQPSNVTFTPEGVWVSLTPTSVALVDAETLTFTLEQPVGVDPRRSSLPSIRSKSRTTWMGPYRGLDPSTGNVRATIPVEEAPTPLRPARSGSRTSSVGPLWRSTH